MAEHAAACVNSSGGAPALYAHMGHSRTPSGCSAISFTSSVLSEPISENYPHAEPETDSKGYEIVPRAPLRPGRAPNVGAAAAAVSGAGSAALYPPAPDDWDDGNEADTEDFTEGPSPRKPAPGGKKAEEGGGLKSKRVKGRGPRVGRRWWAAKPAAARTDTPAPRTPCLCTWPPSTPSTTICGGRGGAGPPAAPPPSLIRPPPARTGCRVGWRAVRETRSGSGLSFENLADGNKHKDYSLWLLGGRYS